MVDSWHFQIRLQRYKISLIFANKSALIFILSAKSLFFPLSNSLISNILQNSYREQYEGDTKAIRDKHVVKYRFTYCHLFLIIWFSRHDPVMLALMSRSWAVKHQRQLPAAFDVKHRDFKSGLRTEF